MAFSLSGMLAAILAEGPTLIADIEKEILVLAHGEGGATKVANAAQGLAAIAGAVASGAAAVAGPPAAPPPATPPAA